MDRTELKKIGQLVLRLGAIAAVVVGVLVLGLLGWQWQANVTVDRVVVTGTSQAPPDTLRAIASVDSGMVMDDVDRPLVADRVARHPWVESVEVRLQRATREVELVVSERRPAGLVVDARGRPSFYLDGSGYAMPLPDSASFDVPLVRGLDAEYHPIQQLAPGPLRAVLSALRSSPANPLVESVVLRPGGGVDLVTTPIGNHDAIPVQVSTRNLPQQLQRLEAFARQVLATRPEATVGQIDLRYAGQIVTRKIPLDG